ncbi:MAG: glycosyltransferase family 39 protein, partial [Candidatus Magasanikbacteria bacterium]|nr:glycosyltransferase family 39 protein [Candidatus Magasanikbacteria bacterium]
MIVKKNRSLGLIFLLAFFLIFWRFNFTDITGDDGHYSFRAVGLTDWLLSEAQTTPLHWFTSLPAWTYLSFHDHPLLLFIVQHLFFGLFGVSNFVAKLPYALFGLGTIWFTYRWVKNYYTEKIALLSALLLSVSAGFIMLARRPLMETGVMFFLALGLYYFTQYLKDQRYWWKLGLALGVLIQVKLTVLFIFPTIISYLCLQPAFRTNKKIWRQLLGILGIVFIFSIPTLVYELAMLQSRGHFSYQFARLLGQNSPWQAG